MHGSLKESRRENLAGGMVSGGGERRAAVTARAVLLGLGLIPLTAWWLAQVEYVRYSDTPTIPALYFHCVSVLLFLAGINAVLRQRRSRWALRREELLVVYAIQVIGSNLAGHDQLQILFTTLAWPVMRATPENRWGENVLPHVPSFLLPDPKVLPALFAGNSSLYAEGHWRGWLGPLAIWIGVVCVIAFTMLCLMALLRRQWDNERLSYPLAEVPLAIVAEGRGIFGQPLFWTAFALAAGLQIFSLARTFFPTLPATNLGVRYYPLFQSWPWRAAGAIPICYYPFAFGLAFLLPLDLSFSCWFFFIITRLELVAGAAMGFDTWSDFPFVAQQASAAFLAFAACVLWAARQHLGRVWRRALGSPDDLDAHEPFSYRTALLGFVGGLGVLLAAMVAVGMRPWVAGIYLVLLFLVVLAFARMRAEVGLPSLGLERFGADELLTLHGGANARETAIFSLAFFLTRTHRQFPMQNFADSFRLADRVRLDQRRFAAVLMIAVALGAICAFWALLHVSYQTGLTSARFTGPAGWAFGDSPWNRMNGWVANRAVPKPGEKWAFLFGAGFTFLLAFSRARFLWWPFHPAGYVVSTSISLQRLWVPLMVSWLAKALILRYGGLRTYRRALPFFLGLVLGQFAAGFLRTLLDLALHLYLPANSGLGGL